jgi:ABC-type Zn uptake system ZnuABC Zn-binding protein ZnuA
MSPRIVLAALALAAALPFAGCGKDSSGSGSDAALSVVATTTQVGDFVRHVGGGRVAVGQTLAANAEPHDYEPRPSDAREVADAEVVFRSGGSLDDWLDDLVENAGGEAEVVDLIDSVHTRGGDPHWWQDPRNAVRAVSAIRDRLTEADPEGRRIYERNAAAYARTLKRLDRSVAACIDRLPAARRKLVTTHDALGYYADRYGLEVIGALIPSLSTQAQPSAGDTEDLVKQIEALDVKAIFPESSVSPKLEEAVARETGAEVGDALWADTLGPKDSTGATYVESIEANTAAIVDGLSGGQVQCRPRA